MSEPTLHAGGRARVRWCVVESLNGMEVRLRMRCRLFDGVVHQGLGWVTDMPHPNGRGWIALSDRQLEPIVDPAQALVGWEDIPGGKPVLADG